MTPELEKLSKVLASDEHRLKVADQVKIAKHVQLPTLETWNDKPCLAHHQWKDFDGTIRTGIPKPGCRRCGVLPRNHQTVGSTWLYLRKRALLADGTGTGKAQPLDSKVLTPSGWKLMGELVLGDAVVDPEGCASSTVTGIYPQGEQDVYKILFSDGTEAESTLDHLWKVRKKGGRYKTRVNKLARNSQKFEVLTLAEIKKVLEEGGRFKSRGVPLIDMPCQFQESSQLPLDPYFLGLLIGDGSVAHSYVAFTSMDSELVEACRSLKPSDTEMVFVDKKSRAETYRFVGRGQGYSNPLNSALRELGLFGHRSEHKFIPEQYKFGSAATRLAVLQGLMDTDGEWGPSSHVFGSTSQQLCEDVADVARSLGLRVGKLREKKTFYRDEEGNRVPCLPFYRVHIASRDGVSVFRLDRKNLPHTNKRRSEFENSGVRQDWNRDSRVKWIREITFSRRASVQCISVSAPSHLYVTDGWTVTHNTVNCALLIAMMKESGELRGKKRILIVCRAPAILQWRDELHRVMPSLRIEVASGTKRERMNKYCYSWEVLIIGPEMLLKDDEILENFQFAAIVTDDVDTLRNRKNKSAFAIRRLASRSPRMVIMSATPLQKRLPEMYGVLESIGGRELFGSEFRFIQRYVRTENVFHASYHGPGAKAKRIVGYQNIQEFKGLIAPMVLRRTPSDIDDVSMPAISPNDVYLDLYPAQRAKYEELRQGVLKIVRETGVQVKHAEAMAQLIYGAQICTGLVSIGETDGPRTAVKLDWLMERLEDGGEFATEKVVVFAQWKNSIRAIQDRLNAAHIGYETIWGEQPDKAARKASQDRFWDDPRCRVLIGTSAIEQSLNLQCARHLVNMDMILNPARMTQLAGRISRDGSHHKTVYVHNLLTRDTQEENYLAVLEREQALLDSVWGTTNELFRQLSGLELLNLIAS